MKYSPSCLHRVLTRIKNYDPLLSFKFFYHTCNLITSKLIYLHNKPFKLIVYFQEAQPQFLILLYMTLKRKLFLFLNLSKLYNLVLIDLFLVYCFALTYFIILILIYSTKYLPLIAVKVLSLYLHLCIILEY